MMNKLKLSILTLSAVLLTGCGFTPVHQSQPSLSAHAYADIRIDSLGGRNPDDKEAGFH